MTRSFVLALGGSGLLLATVVACKRGPEATQPAPATTAAPAAPPPAAPPVATPTEPAPTVSGGVEGAPVAESPDVALDAPVGVNLGDLAWGPGPASLPPGAQLAILEGTPPFTEERSFTMVLKVPSNYTIPPHQHLVTERVTVLQGRLHVGHGPKVERTAAKPIARGGIILLPADHTHYVSTAEETVILLQSVGPWGIYYVDPKDDPRPTPPEKPEGFVSRFDAPISPTTLNPTEITFSPAPAGMLPRGAELAILDGDPAKNQNFVMRLKLPDGYRLPVHTHSVTDRFVVISGALMFGIGDTFESAAMKELRPGAISIVPAGDAHYAQARGETVIQISGTGPFDIRWTNPDEDPAKQPPQQAKASPAQAP
jgi:quercetin dioxygenase-like cupin family protein